MNPIVLIWDSLLENTQRRFIYCSLANHVDQWRNTQAVSNVPSEEGHACFDKAFDPGRSCCLNLNA